MSQKRSTSSSSSSSGSSKKPKAGKVRGDVTVPVTASVDEVMALVRAEMQSLRSAKSSSGKPSNSSSSSSSSSSSVSCNDNSSSSNGSQVVSLVGVVEAEDLQPDEVSQRLEGIIVNIVNQVLNSNSFELTIPNRGASNQRYVEDLDRIVLGDKTSKRQFLNTSHVRKAAITTRVIELVHEVLAKRIHITKRDLFYTDVKLFKDQGESDAVLDDVACMAGCTRTSLHVIASDKVTDKDI
jgi:meiotic recombination protein SPO11